MEGREENVKKSNNRIGINMRTVTDTVFFKYDSYAYCFGNRLYYCAL